MHTVVSSRDAKKVVSIRFSFNSFRLINLDMTRLDCNSYDLVIRQIGLKVLHQLPSGAADPAEQNWLKVVGTFE